MGVDAEMLVRRIPKSIVTDEWLKSVSWRLCEAVGAKHFFISDGLIPEEYAKAKDAWHAAFNAHPLYEQWQATKDDRTKWEEFRLRIIADIGEAPKERRLAVEKTGTRYREDGDPPPGSEYHEDSDKPIIAEGDECLLHLNLWGRYYGPGYERGDILTYCAIAEWLEVNVPGCEVWYGGDSSGVCAEPFHDLKRRELRNHLYSKEGRDYFRYDNHFMRDDGIPRPAACSLCPGGKYCGSRFGYGRDYAAYSCAGCGDSVETRDGGKTWTERKDD